MCNATLRIAIALFIALSVFAGTIPSACAQNFGSIADPAAEQDNSEGFSSVSIIPVDPNQADNVDTLSDFKMYSEESSNYTLGKEDVIEITVLRHPEVSGQFIINSEGKIQYEFVGDVLVEGLKKDDVKELLTKKLSEYIISPDVTVQIVGYNSKVVYVVGEVGNPGKIYMRGDTITVREALVQAGLPLLSAKLAASRLITPSESGDAQRKNVNVHKLLYEGDLRENLVMKPGDTLYIPPTVMAKAMRVIQPVTQPINAAGSTGRRIYTGGF